MRGRWQRTSRPALRRASMAEIVNLRRARKTKARSEKEKVAEANRIVYGTPKHLRALAKAQRDNAAKNVDAHRLKETETD